MSTDAKSASASAEVSKTAMLRNLIKDTAQLKVDVTSIQQTLEGMATWAKTTVKPGMQEIKDSLTAEIETVKQSNSSTEAYSRGISAWIKEHLGTKLEVLDSKIDLAAEARMKDLEAVMWTLMNAKLDEARTQFDAYRANMDQKHQELEQQVVKMREEMKKTNTLRAKAEQSVKHLEDTFARLTRERADEEAQLFRKLTIKLEDERRAIEDERRKMADERKKMKNLLEKHKLDVERGLLPQLPSSSPSINSNNSINNNSSSRQTKPTSNNSSSNHSPIVPSSSSDVSSSSPSTSTSVTNSSSSSTLPLTNALQDALRPVFHSVGQWLEQQGLQEYLQQFLACGYESLHVVALLDEADLDIMSISKPAHRKALLAAAGELKFSKIEPSSSSSSVNSSNYNSSGATNNSSSNHSNPPTMSSSTASSISQPSTTSKTNPSSANAKSQAKRPLPKLPPKHKGLFDEE